MAGKLILYVLKNSTPTHTQISTFNIILQIKSEIKNISLFANFVSFWKNPFSDLLLLKGHLSAGIKQGGYENKCVLYI